MMGELVLMGLDLPSALIALTSNLYCVLSVRLIVFPFSSCVIQPAKLLFAPSSFTAVQSISVALWLFWME